MFDFFFSAVKGPLFFSHLLFAWEEEEEERRPQANRSKNMRSREADALLSFVDSAQTVPQEFRDSLCRGEVFDELANTMPEAWLRTRLAAGVCGLTGSKISPWLLIPTNRTSAAWLLVHMCGETDVGRCLAAALAAGRGNEERVAREVMSDMYGDVQEVTSVLEKISSANLESFVMGKLNKKQIPFIPKLRIEVMIKGAERLQRRCTALLSHILFLSASSPPRNERPDVPSVAAKTAFLLVEGAGAAQHLPTSPSREEYGGTNGGGSHSSRSAPPGDMDDVARNKERTRKTYTWIIIAVVLFAAAVAIVAVALKSRKDTIQSSTQFKSSEFVK